MASSLPSLAICMARYYGFILFDVVLPATDDNFYLPRLFFLTFAKQ